MLGKGYNYAGFFIFQNTPTFQFLMDFRGVMAISTRIPVFLHLVPSTIFSADIYGHDSHTVNEYRKVYFENALSVLRHCFLFVITRSYKGNVTCPWCQGFLVTAVTSAPSGELVRLGSWTIPYGETSSQYLHCAGLQDTVTHTQHSSPRSHGGDKMSAVHENMNR